METGSEIEHLGLGCHVDQVGAAIEHHVAVELGLVELTVLGAGRTNAHRHLVFDQVGQVVADAIAGVGLLTAVTILIAQSHRCHYKEIDLVALGIGDHGKLKAAGCLLNIVVTSTNKKLAILSS